MKELWIAQAMDLLQDVLPVMTDEHARDLADDLYGTWVQQPPKLAVARFFNALPGWKPSSEAAVTPGVLADS